MSFLKTVFATVAVLFLAWPSEASDGTQSIYLEDFRCNEGEYALQLGRSLDSLRALPTLYKELVEKVPHMDAEVHALYFRGMTVRIVIPMHDPGGGLIESVSIRSKDWAVAPGLRIGSSVDQLSAKLGTKLRLGISSAKVCGDTECAIYSIRADRIDRIIYRCYTG